MATNFLQQNASKNYYSSNPSSPSIKGFGTYPTINNETQKTPRHEIENYLSSEFGFSIKHSESEAKSMLKVLLNSKNAENDEAHANLVAKLTNMIESYKIKSTIESEA